MTAWPAPSRLCAALVAGGVAFLPLSAPLGQGADPGAARPGAAETSLPPSASTSPAAAQPAPAARPARASTSRAARAATAAPVALGEGGTIRAIYGVHAVGMQVASLEAELELTASRYRVQSTGRTMGLLGFFMSGQSTLRAEGAALRLAGGIGHGLRPARYSNDGEWRGRRRHVSIDYTQSEPLVRAEPPNAEEREPVPAEMQRGTVDTLSAMVVLLRLVAERNDCTGEAQTFDGRRRVDFTVRREGMETLAPTRYSMFRGEAMRCFFEGKQVAGFYRGQEQAEAARPQKGVIWFASPAPGLPQIPVRIEAEHRLFGTAYVHLQRAFLPAVPAGTTLEQARR
ncbi:MAG: DUF3108 domain-containing protein [Alphaproteobacteria bacterium]|nr:DUF3108 domain-containing protein [Alphaproteobacteria bacterium]